jgi:hypothetical protein
MIPWQKFKNLPNIKDLPIHEQSRQFFIHYSNSSSSGKKQNTLSYPTVCQGPYGNLLISTGGNDLNLITSTGYWALRDPLGSIVVNSASYTLPFMSGSFCAWPSNQDGYLSGDVIEFELSAGIDVTSINISGFNQLRSINASDNITLTSLIIDPSISLIQANVPSASLDIDTVDSLILACDSTYQSGIIDLSGGNSSTYSQTPQILNKLSELNNSNWVLGFN